MNDTRIRRVVARATEGGRLQITVTQLWYLARTGNPTWEATPASGRAPWVGRTVGAVLVVCLVVCTMTLREVRHGFYLWLAVVGLAALVYLVAKGRPRRAARRAGGYVVPSLSSFRTMICQRWAQVYGGLPPAVVDEESYGDTRDGTRGASVALLCPDRAVRLFLAANGIPRRLDVALTADPTELPGDGPVVVLHDASARGFELVAGLRADRRGPVVDAGLPVRAVRGNRKAVTLHEVPPAHLAPTLPDAPERPEWPSRMAADAPEDAEWLVRGWVGPVAAVPPVLLESAVVEAVERARRAADPEHREAAAVGFTSWPTSARPTAEGGN
ncbi:hypothetical protein [Streptomyces broussonetiae]